MSKGIPEGWVKVRLGEICSPKQWPTIPQSKFINDGYPVFGANGQIGYYHTYNHEDETIAITCRGATCGNVCLTPPKVYITGNAMSLDNIDGENVNVRFLYYQLNHDGLRKIISGSAQPQIIQSDLINTLITLASLPEQRKIAAILSSVDDAIEKTKAVIEQTKVVKKGLMQKLLTRGIPGRHKKFKKTPIGEIPEEWEVVKLREVSKVGNGSTPSKKRADYWENGTIPWLSTGKVNDRIIKVADTFITKKALAECSVSLLPKGTILVAMIGQGKTRGMVAYLDIRACVNQNFAYIKPTDRLDSWFLFHLLDFQYKILRNSGRGSNQDALNGAIIKLYKVPLPPLTEQMEIATIFKQIEKRLFIEESIMNSFEFIKTALMQVLLTGELMVKTLGRGDPAPTNRCTPVAVGGVSPPSFAH
ncbi:MAG TPA: restriction endonuclease subunit S [Nitrospirae bacterium]|nr:restriction endonuclease subunit S [Nitrospirota bacterium]